MPISATLPPAAVDMVIAFLLPLILPAIGGDEVIGRRLAEHMLGEYRPASVEELRYAGEAVIFNLKTLSVVAQSAGGAEAAVKQDPVLRFASGLSRSGHQARSLLDRLRRERSALAFPAAPADMEGDRPDPIDPDPDAGRALVDVAAPELSAEPSAEPLAERDAGTHGASPEVAADPAAEELRQAEKSYASASKLLTLMNAHHKGAPPPHSQAAQQIEAQRRVVDAARMKLAQLRRRHALAVQATG